MRKWKTLGLSVPTRDTQNYFPVLFPNKGSSNLFVPAKGQELGVGCPFNCTDSINENNEVT